MMSLSWNNLKLVAWQWQRTFTFLQIPDHWQLGSRTESVKVTIFWFSQPDNSDITSKVSSLKFSFSDKSSPTLTRLSRKIKILKTRLGQVKKDFRLQWLAWSHDTWVGYLFFFGWFNYFILFNFIYLQGVPQFCLHFRFANFSASKVPKSSILDIFQQPFLCRFQNYQIYYHLVKFWPRFCQNTKRKSL